MMLTGAGVQAWTDAIVASFTLDELLARLAGVDRTVELSPGDTYQDAVLRIVNTANRDGWLPELQRALRKTQENTP